MGFGDIFLLLWSCLGLTFIIVHSEIMSILKIRQFWEKSWFLKKLFHCSMCTGFWVGIYNIIAILIYFLLNKIFYYIFLLPFASSAFCYAIERIIIALDDWNLRETKKEVDEN